MQDPATIVQTLGELKKLGVKLDIDDFGTGHSSLSCLRDFPVDVLKIDRSFVENVDRDRSFAALLQAVVTLADNLGLMVVAEGVEDAEQVTFLQALGCHYGQGYFFGKPMSAGEVFAAEGWEDESVVEGRHGPTIVPEIESVCVSVGGNTSSISNL